MNPLDEIPPYQLFGGTSDEAWRWLLLDGPQQCSFLGRYLPTLPGDPDFEARFVGSSGTKALSQGFETYELVRKLYAQYAKPLTAESRVLDFGCGWGRVIRFFLKDVAPENLIGIDSTPAAVETCLRTNRWARFEVCDPLPPSSIGARSCDLIYAISVFSHLPEETHWRWLKEFERILAPGGVLVVTTFPRWFLASGSDSSSCVTDDAVALEESLSTYDRGDFCFQRLKDVPDPHFGDAFIPEQYVRERWSELFIVQDYFGAPPVSQNVIVCTKRR